MVEFISDEERKKRKKLEKQDEEIVEGILEEGIDYDRKKTILSKKDKEKIKDVVLIRLASHKPREATELIVEEILKHNKIYTIRNDEKVEMWIYNEGIYTPKAKTFIKEDCRDIFDESYTSNLGNEVITKIEADTYIDEKDFFGNVNIKEIAVENGILNIFTKELRPFDSNNIFFNKLPITFDPSKKCPAIQKHFKEVLKNKEDVPVIEELFGYLLLKEYKIEKAFMFCGSGRNGKGKSLELMKRFLGIENCANIPLQQFETDIFSLGELFNKMANLSGDIDKRALTHTGAFKNLTGRDLISAPRKFLNRVNFVNYAKLVFCANELPITFDSTPAFFNRWVTLEFPYVFISQKEYNKLDEEEKTNYKIADPDIINKLTTDDELSGLLNIALKGLKRLLEQKDFSYSKSVAEVREFWIRKSDSLLAFCMDNIEEEWEGRITKQEFRKAYSIYCKKNKLKMFGDKQIKFILTTNFAVSDERDRSGGDQITYWSGIKFKKDKSGKGGKGGEGFLTLDNIHNFPINRNTPPNYTTLTELPNN